MNPDTRLSSNHPKPLLAAMVSAGCLVLGVYLLRWAITGLLTGELRYRSERYDRRSRPVQYWCAALWGFGTGAGLALGGVAVLYLGMVRKLL